MLLLAPDDPDPDLPTSPTETERGPNANEQPTVRSGGGGGRAFLAVPCRFLTVFPDGSKPNASVTLFDAF